MDAEQIRSRVAQIAALDDDEAQHGEQDTLWADTLAAIAAGEPDAANLAKAALEVQELNFRRWYA